MTCMHAMFSYTYVYCVCMINLTGVGKSMNFYGQSCFEGDLWWCYEILIHVGDNFLWLSHENAGKYFISFWEICNACYK